ncbi:P-loop containing nucleoside triphosphate hydrolase protein, partial [Podospora appendiculata]
LRPGDVVIALMGVTGAGKTSFIDLMTDEKLKIGNSLKSCTTDVGIHKCRRRSDGKTVWLVDTPGFDDTYKSDTDILKEIAEWLVTAYDNKIFLTGIVYLHPISEARMKNSTMRNLRMFKKLVGAEGLARVVLATTFWSKVADDEGHAKEQQLMADDDFWGYMMGKGSQVFRHYGTAESATVIVDTLIHHQAGAEGKQVMELAIQQEVAVEGKKLNETAAGRSLEDELEFQRRKFEADLQELRKELEEAIREKDREYERILKENEREYVKKYTEADPEKLNVEVKRGAKCIVM